MIEELPINRWTNDFKNDFLDTNLTVKGGHVEDYFDDGDEHRIKIEIHTENGALDTIKAGKGGITNWFNLESDVNLTNMVCYNGERKIKKFDTTEDILLEFYNVRLS